MKKIFFILFFIFRFNLFSYELNSEHLHKWKEDISFLQKKLLNNHPNPFKNFSKEEFEKDIKILKKNLSYLEDKEISIILMKLIAKIKDAHTSVFFSPGQSFCMPLRFYWFEDGIFIIKATKNLEKHVGAQLLAINECSIDEVIKKISSLLSIENLYGEKNLIPKYLVLGDILDVLKICKSKDEITIKLLKNNKEYFLKIPKSISESEKSVSFYDKEEKPFSYRFKDKNFWYSLIEKNKALFIQYNKCINSKMDNFKKFSKDISKILSNEKIKTLVLDIRFNSGGNSKWFTKYLFPVIKKYVKKHDIAIYLLIGRKTYSSAIWVIRDMISLDNVKIIGEPISNKPNHFGEVKKYTLPHSRLVFTCSSKYFDIFPGNLNSTFYPQICIPEKSIDYFSKKDTVLNYIIKKF